jgi:hypothetical protein
MNSVSSNDLTLFTPLIQYYYNENRVCNYHFLAIYLLLGFFTLLVLGLLIYYIVFM